MTDPRMEPCEHCDGEGRIIRSVLERDGYNEHDYGPCPYCTGSDLYIRSLPVQGALP